MRAVLEKVLVGIAFSSNQTTYLLQKVSCGVQNISCMS